MHEPINNDAVSSDTTPPAPATESDDILSIVSPDNEGRFTNSGAARYLMLLPAINPGSELLANQNLVFPDELISGVLHRTTKGVVAGPSKAGKSWLQLDIAVSVATGSPVLGYKTTQGKVLYANLEIPPVFFKQRLEAVMKRKGINNIEHLDVWNLRGHFRDADQLVEGIAERAEGLNYSLIVIDPIYKLMVGRSENSASGVGVLCQRIERIMTKTKAAVIYAHHFTKGNQAKKKAMDRMSGSGVFARDADTIITLTEHQHEGCFAVEMTLRNLPEQHPFVVEWDFPVMVMRHDLDPADLKTKEGSQSDSQEYLLQLLDEQPLTAKDWQLAAESVSRSTFFRTKARLEASGKVTFNPKDDTWAVSRVETRETKAPATNSTDEHTKSQGT